MTNGQLQEAKKLGCVRVALSLCIADLKCDGAQNSAGVDLQQKDSKENLKWLFSEEYVHQIYFMGSFLMIMQELVSSLVSTAEIGVQHVDEHVEAFKISHRLFGSLGIGHGLP